MDLRISSGLYKNTKLQVADETRPVRDRAKLAVFSKIIEKLDGAECLDLYAGSGNLGFEAISRGALKVDFVEVSPFAIMAIQENIKHLKENFRENFKDENIRAIKKDALDFISNEFEHYDIVFADPPYDMPSNHLLKMIDNVMKKDALLVFFHKSDKKIDLASLNPNLRLLDSRDYGITTVDFIAPV